MVAANGPLCKQLSTYVLYAVVLYGVSTHKVTTDSFEYLSVAAVFCYTAILESVSVWIATIGSLYAAFASEANKFVVSQIIAFEGYMTRPVTDELVFSHLAEVFYFSQTSVFSFNFPYLWVFECL